MHEKAVLWPWLTVLFTLVTTMADTHSHFWKTLMHNFWHISNGMDTDSSVLTSFNCWTVVGFLACTLCFAKLQTKTFMGVKFDDHAGQSVGPQWPIHLFGKCSVSQSHVHKFGVEHHLIGRHKIWCHLIRSKAMAKRRSLTCTNNSLQSYYCQKWMDQWCLSKKFFPKLCLYLYVWVLVTPVTSVVFVNVSFKFKGYLICPGNALNEMGKFPNSLIMLLQNSSLLSQSTLYED